MQLFELADSALLTSSFPARPREVLFQSAFLEVEFALDLVHHLIANLTMRSQLDNGATLGLQAGQTQSLDPRKDRQRARRRRVRQGMSLRIKLFAQELVDLLLIAGAKRFDERIRRAFAFPA